MVARALALFAIALALLVGCAPAPPAPTQLPVGVTTSVYQNRFDYSQRVLEIKVSNDSDSSITVTTASFSARLFATAAEWDRETVITPGTAVDLRVQLGDAVCPAPSDPAAAVTIAFSTRGGSGSATVTPTDPMKQLATITAEDCLDAAVARHATIEAAPSVDWTPGAHTPATLDITATPKPADGTLTIVDARGTLLLATLDVAGAVTEILPVDMVVEGDGEPFVIRLTLIPARCDPHAVAEDKRGTFFRLDVEVSSGEAGIYFVPVSDTVRASLYAFVADYCGFAE